MVNSPWQDLDGVAEDEDDHNREGNTSQPDLIKMLLRCRTIAQKDELESE